MRGKKLVGVVWGVAGLVAACSGGSGDEISAPETEDGLLSTVSEYGDILVTKPGDTYQFLSEQCRESISRSDWAGQMVLASSYVESFYGFGLDELEIGDIEVVSLEDGVGIVVVASSGPDGESLGSEEQRWYYENGGWVTDDCDTLGSSDSAGSETQVSSETALGWPAKFCQLSEGMTRDEVRSIMGEPTAEFLDESSQDQYQAFQFNITVFYSAPRAQDPDPMKVRVTSLSADSTGQFTDMTAEDVALFPCADSVFDAATIAAAQENSGG